MYDDDENPGLKMDSECGVNKIVHEPKWSLGITEISYMKPQKKLLFRPLKSDPVASHQKCSISPVKVADMSKHKWKISTNQFRNIQSRLEYINVSNRFSVLQTDTIYISGEGEISHIVNSQGVAKKYRKYRFQCS